MLTLLLSGCANINWWGETDSVKISKGDTLYSISRQYGVPLKQLININNLKAPYTLKQMHKFFQEHLKTLGKIKWFINYKNVL